MPAPIPVSTNPYPGMMFNPGRMVPPRPRGAAGIRGLGAPGTPPPRSLVRQLNSFERPEDYDMALKYVKFVNQFGFQPQPGLIPQGPPTSPPPMNGGNGNAFFNPNIRMMAPPPPGMGPPHPMAAFPFPFQYYNN